MFKTLPFVAAVLYAGCVLMPAGIDTLGRITLTTSRTQAEIVFKPKHHDFGFAFQDTPDQGAYHNRETQRVRVFVTNIGSQAAEVGTSRWRDHDTFEADQKFQLQQGIRTMVYEGPLSRCGVSVLRPRGIPPRTRPLNFRVELEPASPQQQEFKLAIVASWGNP